MQKRAEIFEIFGLCCLCGKRKHPSRCAYGDIWCKWPQCGVKNEHNTTLCPNIPDPINEVMVQEYQDHVEHVWKLRSE